MNIPEHYESDLLFFFQGKPLALTLYQTLSERLARAFPDAAVKVQKSQISFYGRHLFAMASLPRQKGQPGLMVSFGLGYRLSSPRVAAAAEPYPGRWTHHVPVSDAEQIDGELLDWLREAWEFSEAKR